MEVRVGGLLFTSNFDSGNLAKVEKVVKDDAKDAPSVPNNIPPIRNAELQPDFEFNVWTKPDCANTVYENGNRSWFYFGIRGASAGKLIKINIMNMNRQGRLYSQGFCPVIHTVPGKPKWERIRDKPTFESVEGQFVLSFFHRFTEVKGTTTYFAFAYPHSYLECQNKMNDLEQRFSYCKNIPSVNSYSADVIYFHRELLCHSLEKLEVNLLTISSFHGITDEEEPRFDPKLFPSKDQPRCRKFEDKRVFVLTSRVHPGETPASFVFSGFLNFILREDDPRAIQLRKQFVFKLIPILNPDGVLNGHYRTDTRGVNLNRVYNDPSFELNPSIYAAKSIIVYYHVSYRLNKDIYNDIDFPPLEISEETSNQQCKKKLRLSEITNASICRIVPMSASVYSPRSEISQQELKYKSRLLISRYNPKKYCDNGLPKRPHSFSSYDRMTKSPVKVCNSDEVGRVTLFSQTSGSGSDTEDSIESKSLRTTSVKTTSKPAVTGDKLSTTDADLTMHLSTLTVSDNRSPTNVNQATLPTKRFSEPVESDCESEEETNGVGNEGSDEDREMCPALDIDVSFSPHLNNTAFRRILPQHSGVAFYIDLHGHASRKGCFIYGNFLEGDESQIQNMLYPKLVSLNTANFEFDACNFSQRNMYLRDKRDGLSKEGSGRVAIHKSTGIIHSYTLECNYNTGKVMNSIPPAYGDNGRASPPTIVGIPPKYTPAIYEDVGKAVAIAALDMYETNPWSRITLSEYKSLIGARDWLKKYCLVPKGFTRPKNYKPPMRTHSLSSRSRVNTNDSSSSVGVPTPSGTSHHSSQLSTKKELRPLKEVSRRFSSCPRKLSLLTAEKERGTALSYTKTQLNSYTSLSGPPTELPVPTSSKVLPPTKLHQNKPPSSVSLPAACESVVNTTKITLSRYKSMDSYVQKMKAGHLRNPPTTAPVRSKPTTSNPSVYERKSLGKSRLNRSVSSASDNQRPTHQSIRNHTRSMESPCFNSNKAILGAKLRHIQSASHSTMPKKKTDLAKGDSTIPSFLSSETKKNFIPEPTIEVQRNIPPKKKRKFSLFKKRQAINFLKGNLSKNVFKDEHCHNIEVEKLPRKRKKSTHRSLPFLAPLQVSQNRPREWTLTEKDTSLQSHLSSPSNSIKSIGSSIRVQGYSMANLSNKFTKELGEPSWSTSNTYSW